MSWRNLVLIGVGGLAAWFAMAELPSMRRYLRMRRM